MFTYYWGLLRDIPRLMRLGLEGVLFWVGAVILPLILWIQPGLREWFTKHPAPGWLPVALVGGGLLYGLARANYERVKALQDRLAEYECRASEKEVDLVGFAGDWKLFLARKPILTKDGEVEWLKEADDFQRDWQSRVVPHLDLREKNRVRVIQVDVPLLHLEAVAGVDAARPQRIAKARAEIQGFLDVLDTIIEELPRQARS